MTIYSAFAYFTMFSILFLITRAAFLALFKLHQTRKELQYFQTRVNSNYGNALSSLRHEPHWQNIVAIIKGSSAADIHLNPVLPQINQLNSFKAIAPAMGLLFTVISIMHSAQSFSASADVKQMFAAVSVGLGTTAIAAFCLIVARVLLDLLVRQLSSITAMSEQIAKTLQKKLSEVKSQAKLNTAGVDHAQI